VAGESRETSEVRFYILSRYLGGKRFAESVRDHWRIEAMHWVLDGTRPAKHVGL
jgi:predicted transposase YbfD/YdcC